MDKIVKHIETQVEYYNSFVKNLEHEQVILDQKIGFYREKKEDYEDILEMFKTINK